MRGDTNEFDVRRDGLSSAKRALLARRLDGKRSGTPHKNHIPKRSDGEPASLSISQQSLFYMEQISPGRATYNIPLAYDLSGPLNAKILREALDRVVLRHDVLRSRIVSNHGSLQQHIDSPKPGLLELVDLCDIPMAQREKHALDRAHELARRAIDFSNGPVLRVALFKKGETSHLLVLVVHHIVFDGWSAEILLNELAASYNALTEHTEPRLTPLTLQYADYATWQRSRAQSGAFERDLTYWKKRLRNDSPQLEFLSKQSPALDSLHCGSVVFAQLSPAVVERLHTFCTIQHRTLFTVLLSVWKLFLFHRSGNSDILVGTAVAGRLRPELEQLLGYFVNMLVLRTEISGKITFLQLLDRVHVTSIEAQEHQELPFETLVQELKPYRQNGQTPLVETVFQLQNAPASSAKFTGLDITYESIHSGTAKFPLMLIAMQEECTLSLTLEFSTAIFDAASAQQLLEHYTYLLELVLEEPSLPLESLPLLRPQERDRVLTLWNDTTTAYPRDACVHHLFEELVRVRPDATALSFLGTNISYLELNERANQLAHFLIKCGLGPECLIATYLSRSIIQIVAFLAILKIGGAYVPLDHAAPKERLKRVLNDTDARLLLTTLELEAQLPEDLVGVTYVENIASEVARQSKENPSSVNVNAKSLGYVMYTSGSSGAPKGVCIEHRGIVRLVRNTNYVDFRQDDVFLQLAPVSFDASTFEIWGPLLNGSRLVIYPPDFSSLKELGLFLQREGITTLWLTAGIFHRLVDGHLDSLSGVRQLLAGGDILSPQCVGKVLETFPACRLINGYGPTETTTFACCHTLELEDVRDFVPIGVPISNTKVYVLDPGRNPVPVGTAGELYIGGDGVARGYLNRPDETRERFVPDPFQTSEDARMYRTGDLVQWLPEGTLRFLRRMDDQVKIRGFRVEPSEIEFALEQHPEIAASTALVLGASPDLRQLVAFVVLATNSTMSMAEIRRYLSDTLPDYMLPSAVMPIAEIPLNANGKVDRAALATFLVDKPVEMLAHSNVDPTYLPLIALWKRLLRLGSVGPDENFFDLGGHSLLALEMVDALQEEFSVRISLRSFLEHPTVTQLAALLHQEPRQESPSRSVEERAAIQKNFLSTAVPIRPTGTRTPFFFICGAADVAEAYGRLASHMRPDRPFYGIQESLQSLETGGIYTVEELADQFIDSMRAIQPHGPYCIGGWSFGGIVAFQMAQRLLQLGEQIRCLALVDCEARPETLRWYRRSAKENTESIARKTHGILRGIKQGSQLIAYSLPLFRGYAGEFLQILRSGRANPGGSLRSDLRIREYLRWAREDMRENFEFRLAVKRGTTTHRTRLTYTQDPYVRTLHRVISNRRLVMESYVTTRYPGRIVLVRASQAPLVWRFSDKALGWDKVAMDGISLKSVPGDHMSIIREPHVTRLAEALQESLDEAEENR